VPSHLAEVPFQKAFTGGANVGTILSRLIVIAVIARIALWKRITGILG